MGQIIESFLIAPLMRKYFPHLPSEREVCQPSPNTSSPTLSLT